jgi:hypothetical protein
LTPCTIALSAKSQQDLVGVGDEVNFATRDLADVEILQLTISTFSEDKCRALAKQFVANRTWQVPTRIVNGRRRKSSSEINGRGDRI